jgi:hypothetical protein
MVMLSNSQGDTRNEPSGVNREPLAADKRSVDAPYPTSIVVLAVPDLGAVRARVVETVEDCVVLTPLQRPATPLLLLRYDATLRRAGASDDEAGIVGTLSRQGEKWVFEPSGDHDLQRRGAVRVDAAAPVRVSTASHTFWGETVDLSATGALIRLPGGREPGSAVELELHLPDGRPPLRAAGRVVRAFGPALVGVRFERLDGADERRLARFLLARQWAMSRRSAAAESARPHSRVAS